MTKERKVPAIAKPVFDETTTLRFAEASGDLAGISPQPADEKGRVPLTLLIKPELYAVLEREASRKGRSVESLVRKHLTKHFGGD